MKPLRSIATVLKLPPRAIFIPASLLTHSETLFWFQRGFCCSAVGRFSIGKCYRNQMLTRNIATAWEITGSGNLSEIQVARHRVTSVSRRFVH